MPIKSRDLYMESVQKRSLTTLSPLIADNIELILPNGARISGKEDFEQLHRDWFEDEDWLLNSENLWEQISENNAIFLHEVKYFDLDEKGEPFSFRYYLTLIFQKNNEKWELVLDQNTPIPEE